jgi:predicted secreted Zn-dependent protease
MNARYRTGKLARLYLHLGGLVFLAAICLACGKSRAPSGTTNAGLDIAQTPVQTSVSATPTPGASAAATPAAAAAADRIRLMTSTSNQTYAVYGASTEEILSYIGSYGPVDDQGQRATGLTETNWSLTWDNNHDQRACSIVSMAIKLEIKVTLPALDHPERLPADLQASWTGFAAAIAAHEQRHVDIALAGAASLKDTMSSIAPTTSCPALESEVNSAWSAEQARTAAAQNQFHAQDQARIAAVRDPIKAQIDGNRTRIESLKTTIASLDGSLAQLSGQMDTLSNNVNALKSQLSAIEAQYPNQAVPAGANPQYDSLRQQYNGLVPAYNALVENYNSTLTRRNAAADESESLRVATNNLVDRFNWTR